MLWLCHCRHQGVSGPETGIFDIYLSTKYLTRNSAPHQQTSRALLRCTILQRYTMTHRSSPGDAVLQGTSCQHRSLARRAGLCSETAVKQKPAQIRNGSAQTTALTQLQYNTRQDKTRQDNISLITTHLYKAVLTATVTKQPVLTCNIISSPQYNKDAIKGSDVVSLCYCLPLTSNPLTGKGSH